MSRTAATIRYVLLCAVLVSALAPARDRRAPKKVLINPRAPEAPAGFDGKSNGLVDDPTHNADQVKFDDVETVADGLGPLYNAQSCRECHQNPLSGGASQITV